MHELNVKKSRFLALICVARKTVQIYVASSKFRGVARDQKKFIDLLKSFINKINLQKIFILHIPTPPLI